MSSRSAWPAEAESDALHARVRSFIEGVSAESFEELSAAIARFQTEHVEPVRRLARARGRAGSNAEIPAVPTDVFRLRRVAAHPPELDVRVFRTSGTTSGARGAHPFRTLETYRAAAMKHALATFLVEPEPKRAIVLAPTSIEVNDSSLSFMLDLFIEVLRLEAQHVFDASRGVDIARLDRALANAARAGEPVLVMGTAFAYVHALDGLDDRQTALPRGSRAMLTGGFKGRSREVPEDELRAGLARAFGLAERAVVGEYGMTELSSQLYETSLVEQAASMRTYRPPAWVRVNAVDPETLAMLPRGTEGIARIVDLANVDSSIAIQTQDRVVVEPNGDVRLFGRLPGAPPRGCSLAVEEIVGP
ncbi:MAG: acyl-protein synthetase [Polyangiaceae bacterium]|nr:acyl-protein synthetase [Polyangiaceae bacterium]